MTPRLRIARAARDNIKRVLRRSATDFGKTTRERYKTLIDTAMSDIADDPERVGVRSIEEVRNGYFAYHTSWSRRNVAGTPVRQPRHLLVFRLERDTVIIAAVVHERELLDRHLDGLQN